jgi:hypothetical protein
MLLRQGYWLAIGLLSFAIAHVCGASMLAAVSGTQHGAAIAITHTGN